MNPRNYDEPPTDGEDWAEFDDSPEPAPPPPRKKPDPICLKVSRIELCDFQAFPGPDVTAIHLQELNRDNNPRGKGLSLLLYGENGSGKSSLGRALRDMLESTQSRTTDFDNWVHIFSEPPCGHRGVTLHFDDSRAQPVSPMEWRPGGNAHRTHPLFAAMAKSRGWLDYRNLWSAIQFQTHRDHAEVFEALTETLLVDCEIPASNNKTFGALWQEILTSVGNRPTKTGDGRWDVSRLERNLDEFSTKLSAFLPDLEGRVNDLLRQFVPWTKVALKLEHRPAYNSRVRTKFSTGAVSLKVTFRERPLGRLDGFLNEARITAIALSLFLAALTLSTPPRITSPGGDVFFPRLLVLDDILISLDMAHRRPLLDVLNEHFSGWQVVLLTHDRAWYEMAKTQLAPGKWKHIEMFAIPCGDHEQPLVKGDVLHLERAREFLRQGEVKAAAVHIRTQFELLLKVACRELHLKVSYVDDPRKWDTSHFWDTVKGYWAQRADLVTLKADVSHSLSWVLNPHSHSRPVNHIRGELQKAVAAVAELEGEILKDIAAKRAAAAIKAQTAAATAATAVPASADWCI